MGAQGSHNDVADNLLYIISLPSACKQSKSFSDWLRRCNGAPSVRHSRATPAPVLRGGGGACRLKILLFETSTGLGFRGYRHFFGD